MHHLHNQPHPQHQHGHAHTAGTHSIAAAAASLAHAVLRRNGTGSGASLERHSFSHSRHSRTDSCASLLFELELEEQEQKHAEKAARLPLELQTGSWAASEVAAQLWTAAISAKEQLLAEAGELDDDMGAVVDVSAFAQLLADAGYATWLRKGTCTGPPDSGLGSIDHTFVVVALPGPPSSGTPTYFVVDPNYKHPFQLSGTGTAQYRALLGLLPPVLVGSAEQITLLVTFLCKEMEKVFLARGVSLPPWRSPQLMNRWLVAQVQDTPILPSPTPPAPASAVAERAVEAGGALVGTPRTLVLA